MKFSIKVLVSGEGIHAASHIAWQKDRDTVRGWGSRSVIEH